MASLRKIFRVLFDATNNGFYKSIIDSSHKFSLWDDEKIVPGAELRAGNNDPILSTWQPGGTGTSFAVYKFDQNDEMFFTVQFSHTRENNTDIKAHVHWTPGERGDEENGNTVAWKIDYSWICVNGVFPSSSTADCTDVCQGTDHVHHMTPEVTIDGSSIGGPSPMMVGRIYRDTGDTWTGTGANGPILLEVDFHFEKSTLGTLTSTGD